jgi:hypothetical protein
VELTLLTVAGCPHAALFEERLAVVLAAHPGAVLRRQLVASEREAVAAGMHGSPTLLVDGVDPFAPPGAAASLPCRLYPGGGASLSCRLYPGGAGGAPSVAALREALSRRGHAG